MAEPAKSTSPEGRKHQAPATESARERDQVHFKKHKRFGEGGKDGIFYSWAGGIGHPYTAHDAVPFVEKLRSVRLERTPKLNRLESFLESLGSGKATENLLGPIFAVVEDSDERLVHTFHFDGRSCRRIKFKNISRHGDKPFENTQIATEVANKVTRQAIPPPSKELVQYVMTTLLGDKGLKGLPKNKKGNAFKKKLKLIRTEAQDVVAERRNDRAALEAEMEAAIKTQPSVCKLLDEIQQYDHFRGEPFEQHYHDEIAANDPSILEQIDDEIVLVVDRDDEIVASLIAKLFQTLYSEEMITDVLEAFRLWSYHQAFPDPRGDCRHPLHARFLREHPQFDVTKAADPHHVSSTIAHDGSHATLSDHDGDEIMLTADSRLSRYRDIRSGIPKLYKAVCSGPYAIVTDVAKFAFRALIPELYQEYVEVQQNTDPKDRIDTREEEPFGLRARLTNVTTADHKDSGDWHGGIAALVPFGKFRGGRLLLRELGLNIAFPSGSICLLRGHELAHSITDWQGESRTCIVHAMHESMRRGALRNMGRPVPATAYTPDHCVGFNKRDDERRGLGPDGIWGESNQYSSSSGSESFQVPTSEEESLSSPSAAGSEEDGNDVSGHEDDDQGKQDLEDGSRPPQPKRVRLTKDN